MRNGTKKKLVGLVCGAITAAASTSAFAMDKYIDLEPPETLSGYGYGYNSIAREFVLKQCVQFGAARTSDGSGASGDDMHFSSITTNDQLADEMGLSAHAKFSASMGVASVSASAKVSFFTSTKTSFMTQTILASYNNVDPVKYIAGDITLKPEYLAMVGKPEFRQNCGDYVVIGEQQGRWFYGTVQLVVKDTATESKLAAGGEIDATYGTASAEADTNTVQKMKTASGSKDLEIHVTSSGTKSASITIDQFMAQVKAFPGQGGAKQTYKLKAVPYESIIANWPSSNPLAPLTAEQKLSQIAAAAYGFISLIDDADFVIHNQGLFALGTSQAARDKRLGQVKARRAYYQTNLDQMRSQAKNCDVDWNSSPLCEQLYNRFKSFDDFAVNEYGDFPIRYTADCYAPRTAGDLTQALSTLLATKAKGHFSNTKGDREVGGGPAIFTAYLGMKPDFTGGDPLATRTLLADLNMSIEEDGSDHTTFQHTLRADVYDLNKPGNLNETLSQCAFRGDGLKTGQISNDPAVCDNLKALGVPQAQVDNCKKAITSKKYYGIVHYRSGKDPREETITKGVHGVINSMTCTLDSQAGDDTPHVGCSAIEVKPVQLDLVNKQDLLADSWKQPAYDNLPELPKSGNQAVLAAVKKLRVSNISRLRLLRPAPTKTCAPGLVSVNNACVPPLKR